MVGETELIRSAGGDFFLTLIAFLIIALVLGFFYFMKCVLDQSQKRDEEFLKKFDKLILTITDYQSKTVSIFCEKLEKHDDQAKVILDTQKETLLTLQNRPCINTGK